MCLRKWGKLVTSAKVMVGISVFSILCNKKKPRRFLQENSMTPTVFSRPFCHLPPTAPLVPPFCPEDVKLLLSRGGRKGFFLRMLISGLSGFHSPALAGSFLHDWPGGSGGLFVSPARSKVLRKWQELLGRIFN